MNISYNWLKEFIELPLDPQQTADAFDKAYCELS